MILGKQFFSGPGLSSTNFITLPKLKKQLPKESRHVGIYLEKIILAKFFLYIDMIIYPLIQLTTK